jgi:hypothetical protein
MSSVSQPDPAEPANLDSRPTPPSRHTTWPVVVAVVLSVVATLAWWVLLVDISLALVYRFW